MDKDEKVWMNLIYQKCFFSIYEAVCVCFAFSCASMAYQFGFQQSCFCESLHIHTHDTHTHTRAHLHCRVWIWSVVTVSVPRLLTGQSTRWAAMLNHTLHFSCYSSTHYTVIQCIHLTPPHYTAPKNALPFNVGASSTVSSLLSLRGKCPPHYIYTELVCSPHL